MTIQEYYTKELHALRVLGEEFSQKNPALSSFLSKKGQDPDVERLLEGFAFLTARLRQYLDEELPEVSNTLSQILWPNYLHSLPSYSVIQYHPNAKDSNKRIPRGEEVKSIASEEQVSCIFTTSYDVELLPIEVKEAIYFTHGQNGVIELKLATLGEESFGKISFDRLRFYLGGHDHLSENLLLFLAEYVESIDVIVEQDTYSFSLKQDSVSIVGFSEEENILPLRPNIFFGYQILQEYFAYRDKFYFIDIKGLDSIQMLAEKSKNEIQAVILRINLTEKLEMTKEITQDNFKLFCTPVVNLFQTEADPISKGLDEEYEIKPVGIPMANAEVYDILDVRAWDAQKSGYRKYVPFESFRHTEDANLDYYHTKVLLSDDGVRTKTVVRFAPSGWDLERLNDQVAVSIDILASNLNLPAALELGDISLPTPASKYSAVSFENITVPTPSFPAAIRGDFLWRIISSMSLNYLSLTSIQNLRSILEAFDIRGATDRLQKKHTDALLEGMEGLTCREGSMILRGLPIRGMECTLKMNAKKYATIGEAYLLARVVNEFLSLYGSVNTYHKLNVLIDQKAEFEWPPQFGDRPIL